MFLGLTRHNLSSQWLLWACTPTCKRSTLGVLTMGRQRWCLYNLLWCSDGAGIDGVPPLYWPWPVRHLLKPKFYQFLVVFVSSHQLFSVHLLFIKVSTQDHPVILCYTVIYLKFVMLLFPKENITGCWDLPVDRLCLYFSISLSSFWLCQVPKI